MKKLLALLALSLGLSAAAWADTSTESLYQIESHWTTQNNQHFMLPQLEGKTQVVAMMYTHCLHTCPIIVSNMQDIEKALPEKIKDKVGFVLISLTPKSDTPETLKAFADQRGLGKNWVLLTGNDEYVRAMAMALNIQYRDAADDQVAHSNIISVLDPKGQLVKQESGMKEGIQPILDYLKKEVK